MNKRKIILQIVLLMTIMSATLYSLFHGNGLDVFVNQLTQIQIGYVLLALGFLMTYILLESVILKILFHGLKQKASMAQCCKYSFVGFFFYCISPAGSGEQPAQLYAMHKDGIDTSKGILSLGIITITFKLALVLLGAMVYLVRPTEVMSAIKPINWVCILGMILSIGAIVVFICLFFAPGLVRKISHYGINLLKKYKIIKDANKLNEKIERLLERYNKALFICRESPYILLLVLLVSVIQRISLLAITAASFLALNVSSPSIPNTLLIQEMIQVAIEMLPLPGGMGVSEALYLKAFTPFAGDSTLSTLVVSRGVSFYCQLVICGLVSAAIFICQKLREER